MNEKPSAILQELESDDELPDDYNDVVILPAYLDDNRFDEIKFPWLNINNNNKDNQTKTHSYEGQHHDEILRHEGVLKGHDLYCLKSVASFTCSSTLIWFMNFLLHKDLQSHYNYLRSCLVIDQISNTPLTKKKNYQSEETVKDRLEIVIKI